MEASPTTTLGSMTKLHQGAQRSSAKTLGYQFQCGFVRWSSLPLSTPAMPQSMSFLPRPPLQHSDHHRVKG